VPLKPAPQAAALHVWPCTVWLHAAAQAKAFKGAPLVIQPAAAEGMGVVPQAAVALSAALHAAAGKGRAGPLLSRKSMTETMPAKFAAC
jgi:hypothetical protein